MDDVKKGYREWHDETFHDEPGLDEAFAAGAAWQKERDGKSREEKRCHWMPGYWDHSILCSGDTEHTGGVRDDG